MAPPKKDEPTEPEKRDFKSYIAVGYPTLRLSTNIEIAPGQHKVIEFSRAGTPGIYKAESEEEEKIIEKSGWYGVKVFELDAASGKAKGA